MVDAGESIDFWLKPGENEAFWDGEEIFRLFLSMYRPTHPLISTGVGWHGKLVNPRSNFLFCVVYFS